MADKFASLLSKFDGLDSARKELLDEVCRIEKDFREREAKLTIREENLQKNGKVQSSKLGEDVPDIGFSLEHLKLQRKREILKKLERKIAEESEILRIGREMLNKDIKRHQDLMRNAVDGLKGKAQVERVDFLNAVVQEIERFKLPSNIRVFDQKKIIEIIPEINKIGKECLEHET